MWMKLKMMLLLALSSLMLNCGPMEEDAAHIQLGASSTLYKLSAIQYQLPMVVQVTDINGNPAPNSRVSISIEPLAFKKGSYQMLDINGLPTPVQADAVEWRALVAVSCAAEDANHNGVLDAGEDVNGNGILEPSNPATADAHPDPTVLPTLDPATNRVTTDDSGYGYFSLTYPETVSNWVKVRVTASLSVSGTENSNSLELDLAASITDMTNMSAAPPGGTGSSPYGADNDCASIL
ncbi:MAG: hypothetical protein OEY11_09455 [Gammaproteobacteria bacterium]|nr:hypothetical protein [Gammaproteobacteria bacterium]